jgi:DNA-binding NtrC family response regulator
VTAVATPIVCWHCARVASILYVDDEPQNIRLFRRIFEDELSVLTADSATEALELIAREDVAVVITDQRMPGMTGLDLLVEVATRWPDIGRILLTAYSDRDLLLAAIQRGHVHDYVLKPWQAEDLGIRLRRALDHSDRQRALLQASLERDALRAELGNDLVGLDGDLSALSNVIDRVARTDSTVLIRGETGTGKELVARELHRRSARADRSFVRINCSAFSAGVLESELFGHEAGAFTGARTTRIGRFEQAHRGTLFLDEIGDISPELQVKLLRVLQEREIERVGGNRTIKIDLRLIAASHRNLEELVRQGVFREDLFFRINVVPLSVPPLRTRPHDLAALTRHFVARCSLEMGKTLTISADALAALARYDWPGNVRELRNLIERAAAIADPVAELGPDDFLLELPTAPVSTSIFEDIARDEADRIRDALREAAGSKARAARILGIPRTTLNDRIERLGIR